MILTSTLLSSVRTAAPELGERKADQQLVRGADTLMMPLRLRRCGIADRAHFSK